MTHEPDSEKRIARLEDDVEQLQRKVIGQKSRDDQVRNLVTKMTELVGVLDDGRRSLEHLDRVAEALEHVAERGGRGDGEGLAAISAALDRIADGQRGRAIDNDPARAKVYATLPRLLEALGRPTGAEDEPVAFPRPPAEAEFATPPTDPQTLRPQETARLRGSGLELVSAIRLNGDPAPIIAKTSTEVHFHVPRAAADASVADLEVDVDGDTFASFEVPVEHRKTIGRSAARKAVS